MKPTSRALSFIVIVLFFAAWPVHGFGAESSETPQTIRIGVYQASIWSVPIFAAQQEGFFKRNGIEAELIPVSGGPNALAALAGRSIDVFSASPELVLPAIARGVDLQVVSGLTKMFWELLANDSVPRPAAKYPANLGVLKGKKIGVIALGSNSDAMAQAMLSDAKIAPDQITRLAVGIGPTAAAALERNLVQGLVTAPPISYEILATGKAYVLVDLRDPRVGPSAIRGMDYEANWANRSYIRAHRQLIARFQKSVAQAIVWLQTPSNKDSVKKFFATTMPDPAVVNNLDKVVQEDVPAFTAAYDVKSLEAYNAFDVKYGFLKQPLANIPHLIAPGVPATNEMARRLAGQAQ